jgi:hypothetical protein
MGTSRWAQDADVDALVQRVNPLEGARLNDDVLAAMLDEAGVLILRQAARQRPRRRLRGIRISRRLPLLGVMILGVFGGVAAASGIFVNAHTHSYNHGWQLRAGGPGENLNLAGTNLVQVVVHESAGISYPASYATWRTFAIKRSGPTRCPSGSAPGCKVLMSTGMINAGIARSAFAAWVLDWRQAKLTGNVNGARQAAAVIAKAPRWRATTDLGAAYDAQYFGWMKSFVRAVAAGSVAEVDRLIASDAGAYFPFYDPSFQAWWRAHPRVNPFPAYLAFLERGRP